MSSSFLTVASLIEQLKDLPQDAPILVWCLSSDCLPEVATELIVDATGSVVICSD